jgi:putative nucleotidyltransferase with HDIG domain
VLNITTTDKYQSRLVFQRALVDIAQAAADYPADRFYEQLLDSCLEAIHGAEGGTILVRADDDQFYYRAAYGFQLKALQQVTFSVQDMAKAHGSLHPRLRYCGTATSELDAQRVELLQQHGRLDEIQVSLAVPVILRNRMVMVISLDNFQHTDAFDSEAVSRAESIAVHVAALLERTELNKQLLEQQVFQEKLRNMLLYALAETDEITFLNYVLENIIAMLPNAQAGTVFFRVHADSYHMVASVGYDLDHVKSHAFRSDELAYNVDMDTFMPCIVTNIGTSLEGSVRQQTVDAFNQIGNTMGDVEDIKATLVIPVAIANTLTCVFYLDNVDNDNAFEDSLELAHLLAAQLSLFLQRFKYERQTRLQARYQKALLEVLKQALATTDEAAFYNYVLSQAVDAIPGVEAGSVVHQLPDGHYEYVAANGFPLEVLQQITLSSPEALLDEDLSRSSYVLTPASIHERETRYNSEQQDLFAEVSPEHPILTTLMLPIRIANSLPVVMYLDNFHDEKAFDDEIIAMAEGFASQVTVVLNRLRWQYKQDQYIYTEQLLTDIEALLLRVDDIRTFFPELTRKLLRETRLEIIFAELFFRDTESSTAYKDQINQVCYEVFSSDDNLTERQYAALASADQLPLDEPPESTHIDTHRRTHLVYIDNIHTTDYPWGDDPVWYIAEDVQVGSAMLITLYQQGRLWGRYNLFFREPYALNNITQDFLHKVASNIAVVLDKQASREALERELLHMQAIVAANEALHSNFSEQDVFTQTVVSAQRYVGAQTVFLIYDVEGLEASSKTVDAGALDVQAFSARVFDAQTFDETAPSTNDTNQPSVLDTITDQNLTDQNLTDQNLTDQNFTDQNLTDQNLTSQNVADQVVTAALPTLAKPTLSADNIVAVAGQHNSTLYQYGLELAANVLEQHRTCRAPVANTELLAVPLTNARRVITGVLVVATTSLNQGDSMFIEALVQACNGALTRLRLVTAREQEAAAYRALANFGATIEAINDVDTLMRLGMKRLMAQLGLETAYTYDVHYDDDPTYGRGIHSINSEVGQGVYGDGYTNAVPQGGIPQSDIPQNIVEGTVITSDGPSAFVQVAQSIAGNQRFSAAKLPSQVYTVTQQATNDEYFVLGARATARQLIPRGIWGKHPEGFLDKFNSTFAPQSGVVSEVLEQQRLRYVESYQHYPNASPSYLKMGLRTLLVIPVMQQGRVVKIICLSSYQRVQPLSDDKLTIAQSFVRRLENAIERVDDMHEVEATREATLRALGLALEYRDLETKGHSERVVNLSLAMGHKLKFVSSSMQSLRWGAYLHDIGKVGVPDNILLKPGKLSQDEFEVIKRHAVLGATLCSDIPFLPADAIAIVRSHHERWDGSGYPDGLASTDIPLMARLFSLVDVYDALTNVRIYKDAWPHTQVVQELQRLKGKQFDPELTDAFLEVVNEQTN